MENIEQILSDTLLERTRGFDSVKGHFNIYPVTLGKQYLLAPILKQLEINEKMLAMNPHVEFLRIAKKHPKLCCNMIAIHTLYGKGSLDDKRVQERMDVLGTTLDEDDMVQILELVLSNSNYEAIINHFGIDKELKDMRRANEAQSSHSSFVFCGKSIYGSMIDTLASKYGWTLDYILWHISYDNIQLLLADSVKTVYLSDEDARKAGIHDKSKAMDGNDPNSWELIKESDWYKRAVKSGDIG